MAALGDGPVASAGVARQGGWRTPASAGPVRQTLIEKGLIYSPDRGLVGGICAVEVKVAATRS